MRIAVLGASGSIGRSTLDIIRAFPDKLELVGISVHTNVEQVQQIIDEFNGVSHICFTGISSERVKFRKKNLYFGQESLMPMIIESKADLVVFAIPGGSLIDLFLDLLDLKIEVAMANKEILVMSHDLIRPGIARGIRPIDSEQSALWQILPSDLAEVNKVILTCSGGPFLGRKREQLVNVRPEEAIKHPRWQMGPKVSLDSATLMNKALEVIESSALFGIDGAQISVLVHPQAVVHAMVEYKDGSVVSQIFPTDMRFPIQYALSYPERWDAPWDKLNFSTQKMEFFYPDEKTFTSLRTARLALEKGGSTLVVFNTANDLLGKRFFEGKINFLDIMDLTYRVVDLHEPWPVQSREDIKRAVSWTEEALNGLLTAS